jgi:hypothetical protein
LKNDLIIQKNVCEKNGVKELSDYAQKEDMSIDGTLALW